METKNLLNKKITQWLLLLAMLVGCSVSTYAATTRIYAKMEQSWWKTDGAAIGAHSWGNPGPGTSWPGDRMTPVEGESDMWYIDLDTEKVQNVIFTRVNGSGDIADWGAKTKDQTFPTDGKNLFTITSSSAVWGDPGCDGEWSTYTPPAPDNIYLRGPIYEGECWPADQADRYHKFTKNGDVFTLTFTSVYNTCQYGPKEFILTTEDNGNNRLRTALFTYDGGCEITDRDDRDYNFRCNLNYTQDTKITVTVTWQGDGTYKMKIEPACTTPTASHFNVDGLTTTYNGQEQAPSITADSGMGTMTVKYDGDAGTGKTNAGTYAITVDVEAGSTYCAATGISLGNFVINKATHPAISVDDKSDCANQTITLSISGAMETSNVTYSINYTGTTGEGTISGSTLNVTTPGIFKIDATKEASANYEAVSTTSPGTITVTPVITWKNYQPNATLDFGSVPIETTSDAITVNFTACNVSNFNASTASACFAVTNGTASGTGDKSFSVTFTPVAKTTYNGTVSVTWTGGSATFNLTGIGTKDCTPPTKDGYNYTLSDVVYDGSAKPVTVTAKSGYGTPTSVKYNGDTNAPSAVGKYTVSIVVPESGDYCATTITLGDFNITCPALTTSYGLLISKPSMCAGDAAATITLSGSQPSNRASYQLYKGDTPVGGSVAGTGNAITFSNITESGTYKVKALSTVTGCSSIQQFMDNTTSLTVNPLPSLTTTPAGSEVTAYLWEPVNLTATTTDGTATVAISTSSTKYEVTDITNGKSLKAGNAGDTFTATYTATSTNGCQTREVKTVTAEKATEDCD